MKHYIYLSLFTVLFSFENIKGQMYDKLIIGKWENIKRERFDGIQKNSKGKKFNPDYKWEFTTNSFIDHLSNKESIMGTFLISDSILIIGKTKFKIEKLTDKELIIVHIDQFLNHSTAGDKRDYFHRVDMFTFK
jgi:hypothetical protein